MSGWRDVFATFGALDRIFLLLVLAVLLLLALSLAFAAAAVRLRVLHERKAERWRRLEAAWEPLILDVLAGVEGPEKLQAAVPAEDRLPFLDFLLRYHRRLIGSEREILRGMARVHLPLLLPRLEARSPGIRARAVQTLAELGLPEHVDALIAALDDESPVVEMIAARAIFRKRVTDGYAAVLDRLSHFTLWYRQFLASVLARGGAEAAPLLAAVVRDLERPLRDRGVALDALRELHDLSAIELAERIALDEEDRDLLAAALRTLEELGYEGHAELARPHLEAEDDVVRAAAVAALAALGGRADLPTLRARVADPSPWVALEAARGLSRLGARDELLSIAAGQGEEAVLARQVLAEASP